MREEAQHENDLARFDQGNDVSDANCDLAFANIQKAVKNYDMDLTEGSRHEFGKLH